MIRLAPKISEWQPQDDLLLQVRMQEKRISLAAIWKSATDKFVVWENARLFFHHSPPPGANDEKTALLGLFTQGFASLSLGYQIAPLRGCEWMKEFLQSESTFQAIHRLCEFAGNE